MQVASLSFTERQGWSERFRSELDSADHAMVLAFASPAFADQPRALLELRRAFPTAQLIGCSTSGEILGAKVSDDSIAAVVARFDKARVHAARAVLSPPSSSSSSSSSLSPPPSSRSHNAGAELGRALVEHEQKLLTAVDPAARLRGVIVLSDGLAVNGSDLVHGLNSVLPRDVVVTGGLAGDGASFKRTWVLDEHGAPAERLVTAVGIYGETARVGHGSKGGWDAFGPERVVTRSEGNVLYELDGRPALQLYKTYLGERAAGLPGTALLFPLALRRARSNSNDQRIVRTILGVDEQTQSMTFAGDIEQGAYAQLMRANFDRLVQGASDAAAMTSLTGVGATDAVLSIAISCVGRRLVLGERVEEETEAALDVLPKGSTQVGYYSYGEISPYVGGEACDLHNQTMTLTTLAEVVE